MTRWWRAASCRWPISRIALRRVASAVTAAGLTAAVVPTVVPIAAISTFSVLSPQMAFAADAAADSAANSAAGSAADKENPDATPAVDEPGSPQRLGPVVQDIPLRGPTYGSQTQRVLFLPAPSMRGVVVMFPGGAGTVGIDADGRIDHGDNFLIRTRDLWRAKGYGVVIVDAIDHSSMRGQRSTAAYAAVTRHIVAFAKHAANGQPVWAIGTSQGSIAAMNAAAHAEPGTLAGVVLTESVSVMGGSHETVFSADPAAVTIPALVVANRADRCTVAPPDMAQSIVESMTGTHATLHIVDGGIGQSRDECASMTPHGYDGIEPAVVDDIVQWMERGR